MKKKKKTLLVLYSWIFNFKAEKKFLFAGDFHEIGMLKLSDWQCLWTVSHRTTVPERNLLK